MKSKALEHLLIIIQTGDTKDGSPMLVRGLKQVIDTALLDAVPDAEGKLDDAHLQNLRDLSEDLGEFAGEVAKAVASPATLPPPKAA